ncbi:MAG: CHAT domain-containing protein [Flavobacteriaceae bacterium]
MVKDLVKKADSSLKAQISYLEKNNLQDSLYKYPYYIGKIEMLKFTASRGEKASEIFLENLKLKTKNNRTLYKSYLSIADYYDEIGKNQKSLEITKQALDAVLKLENANPEEIGKVRYNIGATYLSLGNINEAKSYFLTALKNFESYSATSKNQLSDSYNAVGASMWLSSKLDSAKYYYNKAIKTITTAKGDNIENLYLGNVIKSNISLLEYSEGDLANAIETQNNVIDTYQKVIDNSLDEGTVSKAKRFKNRAITNLAVFYNEQGNLKKANEIITFSYNETKKNLEPNDITHASMLIQIGQSLISLKEYDKAIEKLNMALDKLATYNIESPYWKAAGLYALAQAHLGQENQQLAEKYYTESEPLFKKALGENYDMEFLGFLRNKALFMANYGKKENALKTAFEAYEYVSKQHDDTNFSLAKHLLNLAEVNYLLNEYEKTLSWVETTEKYLDKRLKNASTKADSIHIEFNKPKLILLKTKALFVSEKNKNNNFLSEQINQLDYAAKILEKRKGSIYKNEDINLLLEEYKDITDFSKQLSLKLFEANHDQSNLNKLLEQHESSIYNRIRTRLNLKNSLGFSDVPEKILERENNLKNSISNSLNNASTTFDSFLKTEKSWQTFLDTLQREYPKYFKMRYSKIETSLSNLQSKIPENTTVIRYIFVKNILYAFVITPNNQNFVSLNVVDLQEKILSLSENQFDEEKTSTTLYQLYNSLWKPFENDIETENIIIIPDGELFNLSFETLTPTKIETFKELSKNSLLSKYSIAYNYSLLLLDKDKKPIEYNNNFVAFAPEFNDKMKKNYSLSITDSINLDKTYLTLLPQPFSVNLAKNYSKLFKGTSFINEKASKHVFTNEANEHKIIHIGTHAESNNLSPELSRLIFAKDNNDVNNSLYTYEVYNQNLNSNLAILTACETGKPTYQSGEGMISLAHAFNYAGSESILTSLWKIDEQSSTKIIESFYNYLKNGLSKDKALQQAKLDYIASAEGRTLSPQYWAGLVLIGDTAPIEISTSQPLWLFLLLAVSIIGFLFFYFYRSKKNLK